MTDTNKERAEFEAWIPTIEGYPFARQFANLMWKSYQAGRAAKAPAAPTGWYALSADGMATRCVDRDDAEKTAADSEKEWPNCGPFRAVQLYTAQPAPTEQWMPIETAPKDGTIFIAFIDGLPYKAKYDEWGRFTWYIHHNRAGRGRCYQKHEIDGKELLEILDEGEDDNYEVTGILWSRGFDYQPTGWIPAPPQGAAKGDGNG